jgi:hypothetical protein
MVLGNLPVGSNRPSHYAGTHIGNANTSLVMRRKAFKHAGGTKALASPVPPSPIGAATHPIGDFMTEKEEKELNERFEGLERRLRSAEADAWASREALAITLQALERRGILNRKVLAGVLDKELLSTMEKYIFPEAAAETTKKVEFAYSMIFERA